MSPQLDHIHVNWGLKPERVVAQARSPGEEEPDP